MRSPDKFLVVFVTAIVLLVAVAFVMARNQPEVTFRDGAEPMDVAHNYLLALQKGEYQRAYEQLSPQLPGYPDDVQEFVKQVRSQSYSFLGEDEAALTVLSADIVEEWATVEVRESRFYNSGPFSSNRYSTTFDLELELVGDEWKIADGEAYFYYCWSERVCR